MPYTPPSHTRSPANSAPSSPEASRRSSLQGGQRPSLPRSASYLSKQRRAPQAAIRPDEAVSETTPPSTSDDLKGMAANLSVRQSPPPITGERGGMPSGAVISPPESAAGSEEEDNSSNGRDIKNLKELKDAISQIPVQRSSSPSKQLQNGSLKLPIPQEVVERGLTQSFSTGILELASSRRRTHARSATEPNATFSQSNDVSITNSEEESEEDVLNKPPMVRKKSGELVRPALRAAAHRRPSSMPGTPTFSKAVHFDSHLEHVRHFLQVDRPLAVSAGSSPVDNYDSDTEFPFPGQERSGTRSPPYEWEIVLANHTPHSPLRMAQPVRLERVWLSPDQKSLLGSVSVANMAFQKSVTCRFTLDYWKTVSEVSAEYSHEVRPQEKASNIDRFSFAIKLSDMAHLESKTLFFCVRYNVMGQEFWDNNNGTNFQVDFRKKHLPQHGKRGPQGAINRPAGGLPRSNRRTSPSAAPRPKSMPVGFDDFGTSSKYSFDQPIHEYLGESDASSGGLRLKTKSSGNLASDDLSQSVSAPSGQAFSNRYDFGASLSAAVQAAKDSMAKERNRDGLYMKSYKKGSATSEAQEAKKAPAQPITKVNGPPQSTNSGLANPNFAAVPGTGSPSTSLASSSYEELVNKYCFFGSKQSSPQHHDGTLKDGRFDGTADGNGTRTTNSSNSSSSGSPRGPHHAGAAQHHSLPIAHGASYYPGAVGASPIGSPLRNNVINSGDRSPSPAASQQAQSQALQGFQSLDTSSAPMGGNMVHFTAIRS